MQGSSGEPEPGTASNKFETEEQILMCCATIRANAITKIVYFFGVTLLQERM